MKKFLTIVLVAALLVALGAGAGFGYNWYRENHIFVEEAVYPVSASYLDLRAEDISLEHYNAVRAQLPHCQIDWMVPFQGNKYDNHTDKLTVSSLTAEEMDFLLEYLPELKTLDASGFHDYALLAQFQAAKPECQVIYQVDLGGKAFALDTRELELANGEYTLEALTANLPYLPQVEQILLKMPEMSLEELDALEAAFPEITLLHTVEIFGREYDSRVTDIDLRDLNSAGVEEAARKLALLRDITYVELSQEDGTSQLTKEDVKTLMAAAPQAVFHYSFDFFGTTLTTADEEVVIKNVKIRDENEAEVRLALDLLTNCKRFVLDNCHLSNDVLAQIREDYRGRTKVVWRVWFGKGSALTDVDALRAVYDLVDDNCHDLVYCEDVKYIDFGHNDYLDTCEFVAGMPNLEYIILSGSSVKDLTPFANCKKLVMLELAFCGLLEDISPLKNCTSLEKLNIANTKVSDLSPLDELPMTHLTVNDARVSAQEKARFTEKQPECLYKDDGNPYGMGWRYVNKENTEKYPHYAILSDVFGYPKNGIFNHSGIYTDKTIADYLPAVTEEPVPEETEAAEGKE